MGTGVGIAVVGTGLGPGLPQGTTGLVLPTEEIGGWGTVRASEVYEFLVLQLLEYKTTCSSRRAVLGQMDAGLAKLVEIAADGGGGGGAAAATPRADDDEVEALVEAAESAAVGEMAEGKGETYVLRSMKGNGFHSVCANIATGSVKDVNLVPFGPKIVEGSEVWLTNDDPPAIVLEDPETVGTEVGGDAFLLQKDRWDATPEVAQADRLRHQDRLLYLLLQQ